MENKVSLSCQGQVRPSDYTNSDLPERRWKIFYGYKQEFYLTDDERNFFMGAFLKGDSFVQVGQLTLSNKFLFIVPIKNKKRTEEIIDNIQLTPEEREKSLEAAKKVKKNLVNILNKKNDRHS